MSLKWPRESGNVVETRGVSQIPASKVNVAVCKGGTLLPQRGQEFTPRRTTFLDEKPRRFPVFSCFKHNNQENGHMLTSRLPLL